jgi:hypothetical protein
VLAQVLGEPLTQASAAEPRPERKDLLSALRDPLLSVTRPLRSPCSLARVLHALALRFRASDVLGRLTLI